MGLEPPLFHYSLDWRFLLPTANSPNLYLLREEDRDFVRALAQVGIRDSQLISLSELRQKTNGEIRAFVMPFGLPTAWASEKSHDQVEFYISVRRSLVPGGCLLVGFNNTWKIGVRPPARYLASTPRRITAQLRQAGFSSISILGAMPDLAIPEYIFSLDSRTIWFALQNRFRRKRGWLGILRVLIRTLGWTNVFNLMPCYFALATIEG